MALSLNQKILVVCKDVQTRRQLSDLAGEDIQIRCTSDAAQALAWIESDASISVVVADHSASAALSGVTLLERVQTMRPTIRRVLLAEADDFASLIVGLHSGAIEHLVHKPINPQTLLQAIRPIMTEPAAESQPRRLSA